MAFASLRSASAAAVVEFVIYFVSSETALIFQRTPRFAARAAGMETWRRGRRRALVWQSAPVFSDLQDLRPYSADLLHTRAATVRPLRRERQMASPRGPRADDDDRHDYTMARDSWAKMLNKPFDDAARLLQPNVRGRAVRRRIALLRKARGRWLQRRVAAAFATWAEMSRQFGIAARMLARVCAQMLAAQLSRAWRKWVDAVGLDKRAQAIKRKVLARLCRGKWLAAAWRSWHLFVADARTRERLLDRVFRRLANRHLALGWRAWLEALNALRAAARLALLRRVAARLLDGALRLCAMAWRTWAAHLRMLKGSARLLDIARRLLERWAKAQLSRAFNALRVPRPRQPRQRRLGTLRLLDYDRGRPRRSEGPDPGLVAHMSTLETLLKQLRVMRLEENLGAARAAGRVSGWITPLPANQTLPPPTIPPHYYEIATLASPTVTGARAHRSAAAAPGRAEPWIDMDGSKAASERPSNLRIHAALVFTQIIFGAGSVVGSLGLPAFNPLLFALIREGCAGPILLAISMLTTSARPWHLGPADRKGVGVLGLTIFGNQLFFIVGLKLSNPVAGSIWQPSQPIITAALAIALGWERARARRLAGIAIAFAGCATMVGLSASAVESSSMQNEVIGNACFFINCFATSCYVLRSKPMLRQWPSICITAWAYMCASFYMLAVGFVLNSWPAALKFLCSDCTNGGWHVPPEALPALAYWIIFQSVLAYQLMTWANKFVSASLVSAYSVLQPVTSASLTATILLCNAYRNCADQDDDVRHCLSMPGYADLGSLGVFVGLYFVVTSEAPHDEAVALTAAVNPLLADSEEADA